MRSQPRFSKQPAESSQSWQQLVEEADLCSAHAWDAAGCGRYCAACGLIMTASALCARALECPNARTELDRVESEVAMRLGFYQDEVDRLIEQAVTKRLAES